MPAPHLQHPRPPQTPRAEPAPLRFQIQTMAASSAMNPGSGRGFRRALGAGLARGGPLPGLPEKAFKSGGGTWWLGDQWAAWRGLLLRVSPDHGWCEPSQIRSLNPGRSLSRAQAAADTLRPEMPPGAGNGGLVSSESCHSWARKYLGPGTRVTST